MTNNVLTFVALLALSVAACGDDPTPPIDVDAGDVAADIADTSVADTSVADSGMPDVTPDVVDTTPEDLCTNGVLDEGEDDVDCGGECPECPNPCGNGVLDEGEACDDGNREFGDGCSLSCTEEFEFINFLVPGEQDGVLEILTGADHQVRIDYQANLPDCESCMAGVLLLLDGEVVGCESVDPAPRNTGEFISYFPPREAGRYTLEAAIAWTEIIGPAPSCVALQNAIEDDPSKMVLVQALAEVDVVDYPDVFTIQIGSEFCFDVPASSQDDGAGFISWPCTGNDNQKFSAPDGLLSVLHSGKCLAVDNRSGEPYPEQLVQLPCREAGFQGFAFHREADGYSISTQINTCVEVVFQSSTGAYDIFHRECDLPASRDQIFQVVEQERGEPTVAVGDALEGGVVGYLFEPGDPGYSSSETHGLIVAFDTGNDLSWFGPGGFDIDVSTSASVGSGRTNTDAIVAAHSAQGFTNYAAQYANDLESGGQRDWYLPSREELLRLYDNRSAIGGFERGNYWTSSQASTTDAFKVDFGSGSAFASDKLTESRVRPVRTF